MTSPAAAEVRGDELEELRPDRASSNGVPRSAAPGGRVKTRACLSAALVASKKERTKSLHTCAAAGSFAGFACFAGGGRSDGPLKTSSSFSLPHACAAAGGFGFFARGGWSDGAPAPSSSSSSTPEAASPRRTPEADEEGGGLPGVSNVGGRAEAASAARAAARATASSRRVATAACERLARACATDAPPGPSEHHSLTGAPSQSQRWVRARRGALLLRPDRRPCRGDHDEPGSRAPEPAQSPVTEMALHS